MKDEKPNIIFIMLDTFRADYLGHNGGRPYLPALESLSKRSLVYAHAIAPATYTLPSHLSIFLGKRTMKIKSLRRNQRMGPGSKAIRYLGPGDITIAKKLEYLGYKTAMFSSNAFLEPSFADLPDGFSETSADIVSTSHGFFAGIDSLVGRTTRRYRNLGIGAMNSLPIFLTEELYKGFKRKFSPYLSNEYGYYSLDRGAQALNAKVKEHLEKSKGAGARFLFLNYMESHEGYPTPLVTDEYVEQDRWLYMSHMVNRADEQLEMLKLACRKRLVYLDSQLKKLIAMLKEKGVLDNALLVLTSDHGQAFMEHEQMYHFVFPYEQLSHVPLIVSEFSNGKQTTKRKEIKETFSLTGLHDLILNAAYGAELSRGSPHGDAAVFSDHIGILDMWATRMFRALSTKSEYFSKLYRTQKRFDVDATAIYRSGYKLICFSGNGAGAELYNLREDAEEKKNIADKNKQIVQSMLKANALSLKRGAGA